MRFGVVIFPGSNCDRDCLWAIKEVTGGEVDFIWHKEKEISKYDCIVLPGGFSYGDYLRAGAIARFSPAMKSLKEFATKGGIVLGICNGFQILLEAGLLPGAMGKNKNLLFICRYVYIRVENPNTPFTNLCKKGQVLRIPIAHFDGNYWATDKTLIQLKENNQIIFRYCDKEGNIREDSNPNGSLDAVAGICNREKNILGMMPHPERAVENILSSEDGKLIFSSIANFLKNRGKS